MQNEVEKKGRIFFPDFCKLSLRKFREFDETHFRQELFKVGCNLLARKHLLIYNTKMFEDYLWHRTSSRKVSRQKIQSGGKILQFHRLQVGYKSNIIDKSLWSILRLMMSQLPEPVSDNEISEMFNFADKVTAATNMSIVDQTSNMPLQCNSK